jgi:acetyltransferase-like isoleucine patch superfamily enzyme
MAPSVSRDDLVEAHRRLAAFRRGNTPDRLFTQPIGHPALPSGFCYCDHSFWRAIPFLVKAVLLSIVCKLPMNAPRIWVLRMLGARIGKSVFFSAGVWIDPTFPELITIEDTVFFGTGARIYTHEYRRDEFRAGKVIIREGAFIGGFAVIPCGTEIGKDAVVAACSVAHRDVPAGATFISAPGRIVKQGAAE